MAARHVENTVHPIEDVQITKRRRRGGANQYFVTVKFRHQDSARSVFINVASHNPAWNAGVLGSM